MGITPVTPVAQPAIDAIDPPSLQAARDGAVRIVVWFRCDLDLPDDDEIVCEPARVDALFGEGTAQRLLMTPATAWLRRLWSRSLADELDRGAAVRDDDDVIAATSYKHVYLMRLTGGQGAGHACDVLRMSASVAMAYAEATVTAETKPTQFAGNPVFKANQEYLGAGKGINATAAWARDFTGKGVQGGVVDMDANFSQQPFQVRVVPVPLPAGAKPSSTVSTHALLSAGIFGSPDNASVCVGAAPEVTLVFAGMAAVGLANHSLAAVALGEMKAKGGLVAGDVVNLSLGVVAGLDVQKPYARHADVLQRKVPGYTLRTQQVGTENRASAVLTQMPVEFEPTLHKVIADLTAMGVTVVEAAGNGMEALFAANAKGQPDAWAKVIRGADLGGPWQLGNKAASVAAFRSGLVVAPRRSLDRGDKAAFSDAGGIVVAGGQFSPSVSAMIDNLSFNHGNRVDCFANVPEGQALGVVTPASWSTNPVSGTSLCAPVVAGAAAVVQQMAKSMFASPLHPRIVRALLSDPDLNTTTAASSKPVGAMPDLGKLLAFFDSAKGSRPALLKAMQAQQAKAAARVKAATTPTSGHVHDPYTMFAPAASAAAGAGSWVPIPLVDDASLLVNP